MAGTLDALVAHPSAEGHNAKLTAVESLEREPRREAGDESPETYPSGL